MYISILQNLKSKEIIGRQIHSKLCSESKIPISSLKLGIDKLLIYNSNNRQF